MSAPNKSELIEVLYQHDRGRRARLKIEARRGQHGDFVQLLVLAATPTGGWVIAQRPLSVWGSEARSVGHALLEAADLVDAQDQAHEERHDHR